MIAIAVFIVVIVVIVWIMQRGKNELLRNPDVPPKEGEVVRCRCSDAIYLIENGKRRQFVGLQAYQEADLPSYRNFTCDLNSSVNQRGGVCELIHQMPIGEPITAWSPPIWTTPR